MINKLAIAFRRAPFLFLGASSLLFLLVACQTPEEVVEDPLSSPTTVQIAAAEATWTPAPVVRQDVADPTDPPPATNTAVPTSTEVSATDTPVVTDTPEATETAEPIDTVEPTATELPPSVTAVPATAVPATEPPPTQAVEPSTLVEEPTAVVEPTTPSEPVLGANLLRNPSFEEGNYNQDGVPELQLPNGWRLEWDSGPTGVGNAAWDVYVRPEVRVLSTAFLPPEEHSLYIFNGQHTVKAFKGAGAVSFRLLTDITLEPGTYVVEAKMFADIVEKWEDKQKQWAQDPTAAQFRFVVGDGGTNWTGQNFGQINVHNFTFTIDELKTIPIGIALQAKYAIANNGWFIDDLSVRRIE